MRYWDSSAVVPLVIREATSARCRRWLRDDPAVVTWVLTATEVRSALSRRRREGRMTRRTHRAALARLASLRDGWSEVTALEAVQERAHRLLDTHSLRAADALQLAAAVTAAGDRPADVDLVTFDLRLAEAAEREGFRVLGAAEVA